MLMEIQIQVIRETIERGCRPVAEAAFAEDDKWQKGVPSKTTSELPLNCRCPDFTYRRHIVLYSSIYI